MGDNPKRKGMFPDKEVYLLHKDTFPLDTFTKAQRPENEDGRISCCDFLLPVFEFVLETLYTSSVIRTSTSHNPYRSGSPLDNGGWWSGSFRTFASSLPFRQARIASRPLPHHFSRY